MEILCGFVIAERPDILGEGRSDELVRTLRVVLTLLLKIINPRCRANITYRLAAVTGCKPMALLNLGQ